MYGASGDFYRKRRRIRWWQIPLLPITFPVSLLIVALGWLHGYRLWKLILVFMAVWMIYGQAMVMLDSASGHGRKNVLFTRVSAETVLEKTPYQKGYVYSNPSWSCDPSDPVIGNRGGWPLGKPMIWLLACDAVVGRELLTRSGFADQGQWVVRHYEWTLVDYLVERRIGASFLFMGVLALAEIALVIPWLLVWSCVLVLKHIQVGWRP